MAALRDFIVSKVRVKIIKTLLENPKEMYYVRDLVRRTGEEINSVRRELSRMEELSMVKKEARGNRLYYWFRTDYSFYSELLSLVAKTTGLGYRIRKNKGKIGRLSFVVFSGEFVRRRPKISSDQVDILVVGDHLKQSKLLSFVSSIEALLGKELRYAAFETTDFQYRLSIYDKLIKDILDYQHEKILNKLGI